MLHQHKWLLMLCLVVILSGCQNNNNDFHDDLIWDFQLQSLDHKRFYLNEHENMPVLLLFWATWCTICKKEMLDLNALCDSLNTEKLVVASICIDPENNDDVRRISSKFQLSYPILLDYQSQVAKQFRVVNMPTTILLDSQHKIKFRKEGYSPLIRKQLITHLNSILKSELQL